MILVFIETREGKVKKSSLEALSEGKRRAGDIVNLEADIIAKYVENLKGQKRQGLNFELLREYGFVGERDAG